MTALPFLYGDWKIKYAEIWLDQISAVKKQFGDSILNVVSFAEPETDVPVIICQKDSVVDVLRFLKTDSSCEYLFLADLTATDETPRLVRFDVVYQLFSHKYKCRIRVKTPVGENEQVPTAVGLWKGVNWAEREVWDMFGIQFSGHPDLRRILLDERWQGHPLRKDYPLRGYQCFSTPEPINPELLK